MSNDITGQQFDKLTVIKRVYRESNKNSYYLCKCDCGNTLEVARTSLVSGKSTNCGCVRRERFAEVRDKAGFVDNTQASALRAKLSKSNTSGVKGVTWDASRSKWKAQIKFKGKNYNLGRFDNFEDAVKARKTAEENLHEEFLKWYESDVN